MGFVAIDFGCEVAVFSANGEKVSGYRTECPIAYICAVTSRDDIDFLVHSDQKGNFEIVEAGRPENRATLCQLVWPVCLAEYEAKLDCLVVVSTTGKMMLFMEPFSVLDKDC
jgi:hypothetical protein